MAMFHFRLKSDKKPDGTKISAVQHVDYIRREGNFANIENWHANNKFCGNFISSAEVKDACNGLETLLYKTDVFGSIRNSAQGIEVTEKASPTTLAIALMLADEKMEHKPLIISGSPAFKKSILNAALFSNLPVTFADNLFQNEFLKRKEQIENDRKKYVANGGVLFNKRPIPQSNTSPFSAKTIETATTKGLCLPTLSQLPLVHSESDATDLLLSPDESDKLEQLAKNCCNDVRWDFSDERKKLAKWTAEKILERIDEKLDHVFASSHVEYINREKAFESRGGCIFHSHHLPKWAKDDPKKFFKAADKYEGVGNRRYMEIEFALPNELKTVEQYHQIIDAFIAKHLKDHYYAYAIHNKIGTMSNGQHHPHVHIMFSERLIDDVEKIKERAACNFFKYPARKKKDGSELSFQEKYKRGAPKNRNWADKYFLSVIRADFAQIQNEVLAKNGFSIRVDHRTLKAQKEEADKNGDAFLARLFNRIPEEYIGFISSKDDDDPKIERLKKFRSLRRQHFDLLLHLDSLTKKSEEVETKDAVQSSCLNAKKFLSQKFLTPQLQEMQAKMFSAVAEVNHWKRIIISYHDAQEQSKLEYMTKSEREIWQRYYQILAQKKNLEDMLKTLKKPDSERREARNAYDEIVSGVKSKIFSLFSASALLRSAVDEIEKKLESPDFKNNIALVTHHILQQNIFAKQKLKEAIESLNRAVEQLQNELVAQSGETKDIYKTREVYDIIRRQYFGLKKEYAKTLDSKFALQRKIISSQRAISIAQNIFTQGKLKTLRFSLRHFKRDSLNLDKKFNEYKQREFVFLNKDWSTVNQDTFLQEKFALAREKTLLEIEKARLSKLQLSLDTQKAQLDSFCALPESKKKIDVIAAGILRKNFKFVQKFEELDNQLNHLSKRLKHTKEQMEILQSRLSTEKHTTYYRVTSSNISSKSAVSLIADAILGEPQAAPLVARSSGNNLEMEKDWELMNELDKDELLHKRIFRDL